MRLDFNVLWIDDQQSSVESYAYRLEPFFEDEGFKLNVIHAHSLKEAEEYVGDSIFIDKIDLVLVDYNLGGGEMGDIAVRQIRSKVPYKDIVFYTALPTSNLSEIISAQRIEGVFCAYRENLTDRVLGVFRSLVKKVLDIDHCRGIVMGVTSDIDQIIHDSILEMEAKLDSSHKSQVVKYIVRKLDDRHSDFEKVKQAFSETESIPDLLKQHAIFSSHYKLGLLKKILNLHFGKDNADFDKTLTNYISAVPPKRDKLGHVRIVAKGAIRTLRGRGDVEFSAEELTQLRQDLILYRDQFEGLAKIIGVTLD